MAERYVQTMKASLIKTMEEGEDVNLALLTYKATPLSHNLPSPAELLNSRKYRTLLPTHIVPTSLQSWTMENKCRQTCTTLQQYQKVVVQLDPDKNIWISAKIIQCPTGEGISYSLKTIHGGVYTRNRRFIKPDLTATETPVPKPSAQPVATRPTRIIKKPD